MLHRLSIYRSFDKDGRGVNFDVDVVFFGFLRDAKRFVTRYIERICSMVNSLRVVQ